MAFFASKPAVIRALPVCLALLHNSACSTEARNKLDKEKKRSEELRLVQLAQKEELAGKDAQLADKDSQLAGKDAQLADLNKSNGLQGERVKSLESELAQSAEQQKNIIVKLDTLNKTLEDKNIEVKRLQADVKAKADLIASTRKTLASREADVASLKKQIAALEATIAAAPHDDVEALKKSLEAKVEEAKHAQEELDKMTLDKDELSKKLSQVQGDLTTLQIERDKTAAEASKAAYSGVQAFMENLGPESLFSPTSWMLKDAYRLQDGQECVFLFNFDRKVEVIDKAAYGSIPSISGVTLLPIRVAYQKVALCKKDETLQAQKESGYIYKATPVEGAETKKLLINRVEGSCDSQTDEIKARNVFNKRSQYIYPYRGTIDGIETIDLFRGSDGAKLLEYNMGSGNPDVRASNCAAAIASRFSSPLTQLACRLAQGEAPSDLKVEIGCYSESTVGDATELLFNK